MTGETKQEESGSRGSRSYYYSIKTRQSFRPELRQTSLSGLEIHKVFPAPAASSDTILPRKSLSTFYGIVVSDCRQTLEDNFGPARGICEGGRGVPLHVQSMQKRELFQKFSFLLLKLSTLCRQLEREPRLPLSCRNIISARRRYRPLAARDRRRRPRSPRACRSRSSRSCPRGRSPSRGAASRQGGPPLSGCRSGSR